MKTRLLRGVLLAGIFCGWTTVAVDDVPTVDDGQEQGGAPSSCAAPSSGTLFQWKRVPVEAAADGVGPEGGRESTRMELTADESALEALSQIYTKLAIVSIAGPYRSGKSYFLNFLANHVLANGFDPPKEPGSFDFERPFPTSPTLNTEGGGGGGGEAGLCRFQLVPACAKPLPDQEGTALLLLDTPGLMTPLRSVVQEAQVLVLLQTVSSVVLYNTQVVVRRPDVEALLIAMDAAASVDVHLSLLTGDDDGTLPGEREINRPSLLWLIQQSTMKMVDGEGQDQSPAAHLDGALGVSGVGTIKDAFDRFFVRTNAARLPYPVNDLEKLQDLDPMRYSDLSDAYRGDVKTAVDLIVRECAPKELGGKAMDGTALATFLRKLTRVMNIPVVAGNDHFSAFLDVLEAGELQAAEAAYREEWERGENNFEGLPTGAENLKAKHSECVKRAELVADPRSSSSSSSGTGGGTGQDGDQAGASDGRSLRRQEFVQALHDVLSRLYREYCLTNVRLWSDAEILGANKDLRELLREKQEQQRLEQGEQGDGDPELPPPPPPEYSRVTAVFESRSQRWNGDIVPDIVGSHPDMEVLLVLRGDDSATPRTGELTAGHIGALWRVVDSFLEQSLAAATQQAQEAFEDQMNDVDAEVQNLPRPPHLSDVDMLSLKAKNAAWDAYLAVKLAVGDDKAKETATAKGWAGQAEAATRRWMTEAQQAVRGAGNDGGGGGDAGGKDAGAGAGGGGGDEGGGGDGGDGRVGVDEAVALAERVLRQHHSPCVEKVTLKTNHVEKFLTKCRKIADEEWAQGREESDKQELLDERKPTVLDKAIDEKESEHENSLVDVASAALAGRFRDMSLELELPEPDQVIDRLFGTLSDQLQKDYPHRNGFLLASRELQRKIEQPLRKAVADLRTKNDHAWMKACGLAAENYTQQASRATSFFSLAPLRYSEAPPFEPARCFVNSSGIGAKTQGKVHRARNTYLRGTWGRRWLVWLALRVTFVLALTAGTLLAAGRQLQHRPVAIACLAASGFHLVVLCLSVSDGLTFGTRPWLLASAILLFCVGSGATVGSKRGRKPNRAIWSTSGRRAMGGNGGSLMPLFQGAAGAGSGGGKNGRSNGGGGRGEAGGGSWGTGRHKE